MKKLLIILFLFISISTSATNYYVKTTGSDDNTGLSNAQAWASVAKVVATASASDSVFFNRDDTWREVITPIAGTATVYTYYGAYGTGTKPKFLGSVTANSGWTNISGNIWQNSNAAFTVDVGNIIFNNEESCGIKQMAANPTLDHQGDFWYDFVNDRIRMYSVGNPATFYSNIECALKQNAINHTGTHANYVTYQNLDFRYWGVHVYEDGGDFVNFLDLDISYIGGCDQESDYTMRYGNGIQLWEGTNDIYIQRCRIDNIYDAGISSQGYAGGFQVFNLFIQNNIISNCEYSFEFYERDNTAVAHDIYFENNSCLNAGGGWGHNQRPDGINGSQIRLVLFTATKSNIYIRNNIFYLATEQLFRLGLLTDLANIIMDYNIYYQTTEGNIGYNQNTSTGYTTLAAWQSVIGQEVHSKTFSPALNVYSSGKKVFYNNKQVMIR